MCIRWREGWQGGAYYYGVRCILFDRIRIAPASLASVQQLMCILRWSILKFYGTLGFEGKVEGGNLESLRETPAPKERRR